MLIRLLKFELRYHARQATYIATLVIFFLLGFLMAAKANFGDGATYRNSPYIFTYAMAFLSMFVIFAGTIFSANVVLRDSTYKMDALVFTTSISRRHYFFVRFVGLFTMLFSLMLAVIPGIVLGASLAGKDLTGTLHAVDFLQPLVFFAMPNVFFPTVVLFSVATLTRNVRAIYAAGVLLYILYMLASLLGNSPLFAGATLRADGGIMPFLVDPFGLASFFTVTRSWTDLQRNTQLFPLDHVFLINRMIWLSTGAIIMLVSYRFFSFRIPQERQRKAQLRDESIIPIPLRHFGVKPFGISYSWKVFRSQFKLEAVSLIRHVPFMVMLLLWLFVFSIELHDVLFKGPYAIRYYPLTGLIVEEMRSVKLGLLLLVFYAAEVVGREQSVNIQPLIYSTPVPVGPVWMAKYLTLCMLAAILVTLNICIGVGMQLTNSYSNLELGTYLSLYFYSAFPMFLFAGLIIFVQNLTANKYLGMMLNLVVLFVCLFAPRLGITHYLLRFADVPPMEFSYFNGFGHYAGAFGWYMLYWSGFTICIAVVTIAMWQRSTQRRMKDRLKAVPKYLFRSKFLVPGGLLIWVVSGGYIFWQANIVGSYETAQLRDEWQAGYEKKYRPMADLPQPVITDVTTDITLLTDASEYLVKGTYVIENQSRRPVSKLWLSIDKAVNVYSFAMKGGTVTAEDKRFKQVFLTLNKALLPGESAKLNFTLEVKRSGFLPFDKENYITRTGTYIELEKFVPQFGYQPDNELDNEFSRKRAGLGIRAKGAGDDDYHLINYTATVSAPADQYVVTVGTLQKSWIEGDRRFFRYKTVAPVNFMFALSAAGYAVKHARVDDVDVHLYYLPGQEFNLESILGGACDAMKYGSANFGSYPLQELTIAAIPQYRGAATAYPGVVFAAERINFLGDYRAAGSIDQAHSIASHETAHQWWANMLSPVRGPGDAMLTESLAKYTEDMVMEQRYGKMYLRNYLVADNRLYYQMAGSAPETPLAQVADQTNVYYQKGSLVFYSMKEVLGEQKLNEALRRFVAAHRYPNKKATAVMLVDALKAAAPVSQHTFIEDSFNGVVDYDLRMKVISCKPLIGGRFAVKMEITANKNKRNGGEPVSPDMDVDIALFDQAADMWDSATKPIYIQKHRLQHKVTTLEVIVNKKPSVAAVDVYGYLPDVNLEDNLFEIKGEKL